MLSTREMSQNRNQPATRHCAVERHPIEYLTKNGFSIMRLCEIDKSIPAVGTTHQFLVRDPDGYELHITVDMTQGAIDEVVGRSRGRISEDSSYWIAAAERHLSTYLCENDDYPSDGRLTVAELSLDDLNLALRWGRDGDGISDQKETWR